MSSPHGGYGFPPLANPYVIDCVIAGRLTDDLAADLRNRSRWRAGGSLDDAGEGWARHRIDSARGGSPSSVGWSRELPLRDPLCARLVEEVVSLATVANQQHHRIDCDRVDPNDAPEFLRFERREHRAPMSDLGANHPTRKLMALVPLGPMDDVVGGRPIVEPGGFLDLAPGEVLVCPAFTSWGIEPVGRGRVVVALLRLHGPPFR